MNDPLGWDYPAGLEHDPSAPWNQKDDAPDDERDMDDASDEECGDLSGNLTSPSALAAVHPPRYPTAWRTFPALLVFRARGFL